MPSGMKANQEKDRTAAEEKIAQNGDAKKKDVDAKDGATHKSDTVGVGELALVPIPLAM